MGNPNPVPPPSEHQFKPGESGNPNGRPKGARSFASVLRDYIERELEVTDPFDQKKGKKPAIDIVVLKLIKKAINDEDISAMKEIIDRLDGKAAQRIDFGGETGTQTGISLEIIHTNVENKPKGDDSSVKEPGSVHEDHSQ